MRGSGIMERQGMNEDYLGCYSEESDPVYALMEISKMLKKL
jgi:hypothetical protein